MDCPRTSGKLNFKYTPFNETKADLNTMEILT